MSEEEEEPRKKRKGKRIPKRKAFALIVIVLLFCLGAVFQHIYVEPLLGESKADAYSECLVQQQVLDERFVECENQKKACEFQLQQCLEP